MIRFHNSLRRSIPTLLSAAVASSAGGWYVDASRSDNKGDGKTAQTAWRSFEPFIGKIVAAGDTLHLKRGSSWTRTQLPLYSGGSSDRPFVVTAYGDESLPLPQVSDTSLSHAVLGIGADHIVVENLAVHAPNGACVANLGDSVNDVVIQDLQISDCQSGILLGGAEGAIVQRNRIENIHYQKDLGTSGYGAIGITLDRCRNVKVLGNLIRHAIDGSGDSEDGGGIELFRTNIGIEIAGNRAYQVAGFLELGGLRANHDTDRNIVIHHNIAIEAQNFMWCSVRTGADSSNEWGMHFREVYVDNNTMIQNRRKGGLAVGVSASLPDSTMIRLRNNLFVGDSLAGLLYLGPFSRGWNMYWSKNYKSKWGISLVGGEAIADPLLAQDTADVLYSLGSGSPAKDAGAVLTYPSSLPVTAIQVAVGSKVDIGALEQVLAAPGVRAERKEGGWSRKGDLLNWMGWSNVPGTLDLRLVDVNGRVVGGGVRPHGAGRVEATLDVGRRSGILFAVAEMEGFRQVCTLLPAR